MKNTSILVALATRALFIVHRVVAREDGKTDKLPTDPTSGGNIDGQDPANWLLPYDALHYATWWNEHKTPGVKVYGVGIVIAEGSGLFCLDLDACRDLATGGWFPHALSFEGRFPGAYRETSVSTMGRHVIGSYAGTIPAHSTRNKTYRMECYTRKRFIAITGDDAEGAVLTDCTKWLLPFLAEFFPENPEPEHGVEWTEAPVAEWRGPTDDAELISRACRAVSPRAIFGGGAAFGDLWRADAEALARAFPSQNTYSSWDRSAADQALSNHLAFWTGNDCERMLRLMRGSALVREKWDRPDYLTRTILDSTGSQREWYKETQAQTPPVREPTVATVPVSVPAPPGGVVVEITIPKPPPNPNDPNLLRLAPGELPPVGDFCGSSMLKQIFDGLCYVQDINAIQFLDGTTTTKERFDAMYGGPKYAMTADGQATKSAWDAYTMSEVCRFPRAETQYFKPGEATGNIRTREGRREINMYQPANVKRVSGNPAPFLDLVNRMLPNGDDSKILLCYMAACCRYLGRKFTWWPFIQGTKGNGKTTIGKIMEYCISHRYTHWAKADQLGEKFNSVFVGKLLVIIDEMYNDDKREFEEILKQLVTAERIEVRPMYGEKTMKEICFNGFLFSNHQNGVRIDLDERRYAPLFCAQQAKQDKARDGLTKPYFIELNRWLWEKNGAAIVYDFLMGYEIADEYNPATDCIEAPATTSTEHAATASLGGVEQEMLEAIKQKTEGFRNGWISSHAVDALLARVGKDKAIPRNVRKTLVTSLGYVPHPCLPEGICSVALPDGTTPRLYVTMSHPWNVNYLGVQEVRDGYLQAQKK